jgi:hypothetical protein
MSMEFEEFDRQRENGADESNSKHPHHFMLISWAFIYNFFLQI